MTQLVKLSLGTIESHRFVRFHVGVEDGVAMKTRMISALPGNNNRVRLNILNSQFDDQRRRAKLVGRHFHERKSSHFDRMFTFEISRGGSHQFPVILQPLPQFLLLATTGNGIFCGEKKEVQKQKINIDL